MAVARKRAALGGLGVALLLLVLVGGGLLEAVPVEAAVDALGNDYLFVAALAAVALLVGLAVVGSGRTLREAAMPDPERPIAVPTAGDEFERTVDRKAFYLPYVGAERRESIREQLRVAAVESLGRNEGYSRADALARVESGDWTDDPCAARFLADDRRTPSIRGRAAALLRGESWFAYCARRTADEIAARDESAGSGR